MPTYDRKSVLEEILLADNAADIQLVLDGYHVPKGDRQAILQDALNDPSVNSESKLAEALGSMLA